MAMSPMAMRFIALWSRSGGVDGEAVYADLARLYTEPTRHYHTLRHIHRCLNNLDSTRDAVPHPDTVELALWCHDVIYVPGAGDNEQRSIEWFRRWANGRIASDDRICEMILATRHTTAPTLTDDCFVVDIDLAVLGGERQCFCEDGARLRAERPDLDDRAYDAYERRVLSNFLARPRIYYTDLCHALWETRARNNLLWRLDRELPWNVRSV
jgi:predicted metal-dependent HD superfamily phosphohydrolase